MRGGLFITWVVIWGCGGCSRDCYASSLVADIGQYYMTQVMDRGFRLWRLLDSDGIMPSSLQMLESELLDESLQLYHEIADLTDQAYAQTDPVYQDLVALLDILAQRIQKIGDYVVAHDGRCFPFLYSLAQVIQGCYRRLTKTTLGKVPARLPI